MARFEDEKRYQVTSCIRLPQYGVHVLIGSMPRLHKTIPRSIKEYVFDFFRSYSMFDYQLVNYVGQPQEIIDVHSLLQSLDSPVRGRKRLPIICSCHVQYDFIIASSMQRFNALATEVLYAFRLESVCPANRRGIHLNTPA